MNQPSTLKTKIIEPNEIESQHVEWGQIPQFNDYIDEDGRNQKGVEAISKEIRYGQIVGMRNWCRRQGVVDPPWHMLKIGYGNYQIKAPWLLIGLVIGIIFAIIRGMPVSWIIIGTVGLFLGIIMLSVIGAQYKFRKRGECLHCGSDDLKHFTLQKNNSKGEPVSHTKAGLCEDCSWIIYRFQMWDDAMDKRWRAISKRRTSGILVPRYTDPFPAGRGFTYYRRDKKDPRDLYRTDIIQQGKQIAMDQYNLWLALERSSKQ